MQVAVVGAGALGILLASELSSAGHSVQLCSRSDIGTIEVRGDGHLQRPNIQVRLDPHQVTTAELVVVATKAQDTASTSVWLTSLLSQGGVLVLAQNGVDHLDRLAPTPPRVVVVPMLPYCSVERLAGGIVVRHGGDRLVVPANSDAAQVADAFAQTQLTVDLVDDFLTESWRKLLLNAAAGPITALAQRRLEVLHEPDVARLATAVLQEVVRSERAAGAQLSDDDIAMTMRAYAAQDPAGGTSMLYDRLAGKSSEHEYILGPVIASGLRFGQATPLSEALLILLRAASAQSRP